LQICGAEGFDWLTCAGLDTVVNEVKIGMKNNSKNLELALRELCNEPRPRAAQGLPLLPSSSGSGS